MVADIHVPESMALQGYMPILAILFGTDNSAIIVESLQSISQSKADLLTAKVRDTVTQSAYPLSSCIWQFNDPCADLDALDAAFSENPNIPSERLSAFSDFLVGLEMMSDTFPYMFMHRECINSEDIFEYVDTSDGIGICEYIDHTEYTSQESSHPKSILIPSVAVGSFMLLASKVKGLP